MVFSWCPGYNPGRVWLRSPHTGAGAETPAALGMLAGWGGGHQGQKTPRLCDQK